MSTRARYHGECGHCSYVAHSVSAMEKHLKSHADDGTANDDQTKAPQNDSEDERSESDSEVCIRPDPEPEADDCLWEEWGADNVTYPRDVDDPSSEHHMGTCDTDIHHFRQLYRESLSDDGAADDPPPQPTTIEPITEPGGASQAGDSAEVESSTHFTEPFEDCEKMTEEGECNPETDQSYIESKKPVEDSKTVKEQGGCKPEADHSSYCKYSDEQDTQAHLKDHQYSFTGDVKEHMQAKRSDSVFSSDGGSAESFSLVLPCSDAEDHDAETRDKEKSNHFFCAHCDFQSSILSVVQRHTMDVHSERPRYEREEPSTWECVGDGEAGRTDEAAADWQMVPDEREDSDEEGPTPIVVAPMVEAEFTGPGFCYKCEVNDCNTLFPLQVDFFNHVKLKHQKDRGQIIHCPYCHYAATNIIRVYKHASSLHPDFRNNESFNIYTPNTSSSYSTDLPDENWKTGTEDNMDISRIVRFECNVNGCPSVFIDRADFCSHVKNEHIHEGGRIFYCAYCKYAATQVGSVRKHASLHHLGGTKNGPELNLTYAQINHAYKLFKKRFACLFCQFTSLQPNVTVLHTHREHYSVWMWKLEQFHPGFSALVDSVGILRALPQLKVENAVNKGSMVGSQPLPVMTSPILGKRTRHSVVNYAHLANAHRKHTVCSCKFCDGLTKRPRLEIKLANSKKNGSCLPETFSVPPGSFGVTLNDPSLSDSQNSPLVKVSLPSAKKPKKLKEPEACHFEQSSVLPIPVDDIKCEPVLSDHKKTDSVDQKPIICAPGFSGVKSEQKQPSNKPNNSGLESMKTPSKAQLRESLARLSSLLKQQPDGWLQSKAAKHSQAASSPQTKTITLSPQKVVMRSPVKTVMRTPDQQQSSPPSAQVQQMPHLTNIAVCKRGCSQHQILMLKNKDASHTKILLLHELDGKVQHAEPLNFTDLSALGMAAGLPGAGTALSAATDKGQLGVAGQAGSHPLAVQQAADQRPALQIQDSAVSSTVSKVSVKTEPGQAQEPVLIEDDLAADLDFDDTPLEDTVEDNSYLYADHEDLEWHGPAESSDFTPVAFRKLLEEDHVISTEPSLPHGSKKSPKKKKRLYRKSVPSKQTKSIVIINPPVQPTRVSKRERKPNVKCLCEDCMLYRLTQGMKLGEPQPSLNSHPDPRLKDPKLRLRPVVVLPDIMMILQKF